MVKLPRRCSLKPLGLMDKKFECQRNWSWRHTITSEFPLFTAFRVNVRPHEMTARTQGEISPARAKMRTDWKDIGQKQRTPGCHTVHHEAAGLSDLEFGDPRHPQSTIPSQLWPVPSLAPHSVRLTKLHTGAWAHSAEERNPLSFPPEVWVQREGVSSRALVAGAHIRRAPPPLHDVVAMVARPGF